MKIVNLAIAILIGFSTVNVEAKMYKLVDANGKVHYSDRKPSQKRAKTKTIKIPNAGGSLPDVDIKSPIPYKKSKLSQSVLFESLELKLAGANYSDVKIGHIYSGKSCSQKVGDLV